MPTTSGAPPLTSSPSTSCDDPASALLAAAIVSRGPSGVIACASATIASANEFTASPRPGDRNGAPGLCAARSRQNRLTSTMVDVNRFWRDLAAHKPGAPFLSPGLGLAVNSFAEAIVALAHAITPEGPRLTIAAASNALAGSSQLVDGELVSGGAPLVVGMSYV